MTLKDYEFYGPLPYPVTIEDAAGHPLGVMAINGTFSGLNPSNVGKVILDKGNELETVWDGAKPDPSKHGSTKGRLLPLQGPPYVDSLTIYSHLATMTVKEYNEQQQIAEKRAGFGLTGEEAADTSTRIGKAEKHRRNATEGSKATEG